ncbi:hypothetical protein H311_01992, partial [Anncaliia algerae PRA109]
GAYDIDNKIGFVVPVERRDSTTLLSFILRFVRPGSIIVTDCWAGYDTLGLYGYHHFRVNHSTNFVAPDSGYTTNHIESCWQKLKQYHKNRYGTHRSKLSGHLGVYMWRQRFKKSFKHFLMHIKEIYSLNN